MIDIYICEDIQKQRELLSNYVENIITFEEYDMELKLSTDNTELLLQVVRESENIGLYFLDIDLGNGKDGLELAKEIREYDSRGFIVFVTSHSEMAKLTFQYKLEALDFIVKDDPRDVQHRIGECMEKAIHRSGHISRGEGKTVSILRGGQKIILKQDDILFIETSVNEHKLLVHTSKKTMEFSGNIKDMERELGDDFFRCHRSYLVNRKWVKELDYGKRIIYLKNGFECPISARMLSQVKRKLK
jgi:two-component system response regulator AgrA